MFTNDFNLIHKTAESPSGLPPIKVALHFIVVTKLTYQAESTDLSTHNCPFLPNRGCKTGVETGWNIGSESVASFTHLKILYIGILTNNLNPGIA
jgi:hypothetical protein